MDYCICNGSSGVVCVTYVDLIVLGLHYVYFELPAANGEEKLPAVDPATTLVTGEAILPQVSSSGSRIEHVRSQPTTALQPRMSVASPIGDGQEQTANQPDLVLQPITSQLNPSSLRKLPETRQQQQPALTAFDRESPSDPHFSLPLSGASKSQVRLKEHFGETRKQFTPHTSIQIDPGLCLGSATVV